MNTDSIKSILTLRYDYTQTPFLPKLTWQNLEKKQSNLGDFINLECSCRLYYSRYQHIKSLPLRPSINHSSDKQRTVERGHPHSRMTLSNFLFTLKPDVSALVNIHIGDGEQFDSLTSRITIVKMGLLSKGVGAVQHY